MKKEFIGNTKDDFKVRYFLFWLRVWSKKRSLLLRFMHELKSSVDRLQEQVMSALHHPFVFEKLQEVPVL